MWVSTGHSQHLCSCPEGGGNALKKHLQMMIQQILNTQAIVLHVNARNTQLDASFWGRTFQNLKVVSLGSPTPRGHSHSNSQPFQLTRTEGTPGHSLGLEEPAPNHCQLY